MLDQDDHDSSTTSEAPTSGADGGPVAKKATRKRATKKAAPAESAGAAEPGSGASADAGGPVEAPPVKKTAARKRTAKKTTAAAPAAEAPDSDAAPARKTTKKTTRKAGPAKKVAASQDASGGAEAADEQSRAAVPVPLFQAPEKTSAPSRRTTKAAAAAGTEAPTPSDERQAASGDADGGRDDGRDGGGDETDAESAGRRKRRRGGRRRRKAGDGDGTSDAAESDSDDTGQHETQTSEAPGEGGEGGTSRRRRRRRRSGDEGGTDSHDDPANTVTRVRSGRSASDEITAVSGSTRLEAKKQRRREGREAGRRRAPIVSEAEFLARRESVKRLMVVRQHDDVTQIAVLEDNVLVEHYVARESQTSLIGNVYLGRVQNVLPSMEAAFIDIGKGRNAVLYAGEVNWSNLGHKEGQPRKIESVLSSGQSILVQVTKDPIGHKGARLTSQVSLAGRFLVYVPDGTTSGISRKLPDTERNRLKTLLKDIVPDTAGVIVRTAAEGAAEDELTRDVERLKARWEDIEKKAANKGAGAQLLYGEPDLTLKVVRDLFTEDFAKLVIQGDDAWDTVQSYVMHVAPDLEERLERYEPKNDKDVFAAYRIDEQIKKGLDRKVWLPSGGSLVIDRTEAMTVVDVNTGKFTGSGGNLEETVTKNNLEAAEEIVRQLRLRDIGGIIVVDFIDMVLESNRDLVLRRLVECLGRDRTRHQVAEVTSLGLVQMTRKRIGTGLLESFSHDCTVCNGRGVVIEEAPVEPKKIEDEGRRGATGGRRGRGRAKGQDGPAESPPKAGPPTPKDVAAMARHEHTDEHADDRDDHDDDLEDLRSQEVPAEPDAAAETPIVPEQASEAAADPAPEPVVPPEEPQPPRVVTRTRRRAASRPAGPPASAGVAGTPPADGRVEPGTAVEEPGTASTDDSSPSHGDGPALHVPVKRKGARKR